MSLDHIKHRDLVQFAEERVNLPQDKANEYRAQARRLRDKLEGYVGEHPDFTLRKMILSGSLAKGTALRSLNDIDIACYISGADAPSDVSKLMDYLKARLENAFPNFKPDQIARNTYSVTVTFRSTELDVDVVPILYDGDEDWFGNLVSQDDGSFLLTNIPRHLEFIKNRKNKAEDFTQVVRLTKAWAQRAKEIKGSEFRFKSFMIEMIYSKLCDDGLAFSDYPEVLQHFFDYILTTGLREQISFSDYYSKKEIPNFTDEVKIVDPVNAKNNVAKLYTTSNVRAILDAAEEASDAIEYARRATTKQETVRAWQKVFGTQFQF